MRRTSIGSPHDPLELGAPIAERREPRERRVTGPAGTLVVWDHPGDPPDTLLLHGIGGTGRIWDLFADAVAGRLRLLAPDARGHGDSAKPPAVPGSYGPADFVADTAAILDALGLERVFLVGHSMGGGHAVAFTLAHPERVRALVIIDIGPTLEAEGAERAGRLSRSRPERFGDRAAAERYLRETSPGYSDEIYAHRLRWLLRPDPRQDARRPEQGGDHGHGPDTGGDDHGYGWRSDPGALGRILAGAPDRVRSWARLATIKVPTLLVRGTRSIYLGAATAQRMLATLPDARLIELDAGHNVQLDRPRELAEAIVAFGRATLR